MRYRTVGALAAAAALAAPVAASAHPSVYTDTTNVRDRDADPGQYDPEVHTRHVVTNHGNTYVFRETNGAVVPELETGFGVLSFAELPGDHPDRGTPDALTTADSGAQAHYVCWDDDATAEAVDALWETDTILAWQNGTGAEAEDPFYNYVPFQKAKAGLDDTPLSDDPALADWIDDVRTAVDVDLATVPDDADAAAADLEAKCAGLGGQLVPPDTIQTPRENLASALIEPLEDEIAGLRSALTTAEQTRDAAQAGLTAANARIAELMRELTPLSVALATARSKARRVAGRGAAATVTGPPLQAVSVRLLIAKSQVKRLRLGSRVLVSRTVTTDANGRAQVTLKPNRRVGRALRRLRGAAALTLDAASADRARARGTLTR